MALAASARPATAQQPTENEVVDAFAKAAAGSVSGAFRESVPIAVPAFHGLEPRLALVYASGGPGGFAGVGWALTGFGTVSRTKRGRGIPRYDGDDVFVWGGQELLPCAQAGSSPSCTTGGTHATEDESYVRIRHETVSNTWSTWTRDGTRTDYQPLFTVPEGTYQWGQSAVTDTHGNTVSYLWACQQNDCYPDTVSYGPYSVKLYRETRGDVRTFATGSDTVLGRTAYRLRSILVAYDGSPVRAYKLDYESSPVTARSRLVSVRQYGSDVVIDAQGVISGGTALPARTFQYANDPSAETITRWP
jgi:hypothetical protein